MNIEDIQGYHAHVYFDAQTLPTATAVVAAAGAELPVQVGRIHEKPVGPHSRWSCQLAFERDDFHQIIAWLMSNRKGLTIFIHPLTGDELVDHRDHALWMGSVEPLKLEVFG